MKLNKISTLFIIIYLLLDVKIYSQSSDFTQSLGQGENCNTSSHFSDSANLPFVTFFGDSLGDFVDSPIHGIIGWNNYLSALRPDIHWKTQNFAVAGYTTVSLFEDIRKCILPGNRKTFKTSNHFVFEIGGNDAAHVSPIIRIMPWKVFSYHDPFTGKNVYGVIDQLRYNVKSIIRYMRHPMLDKDVLVIGNFPGLTTSPSLGEIGSYFDGIKKLLDELYIKQQNESNFVNFLSALGTSLTSITEQSNLSQVNIGNRKFKSNTAAWYLQWQNATKDLQTVLSITLFLLQNELANVVAEENIATTGQIMDVPDGLAGNGKVRVPNRQLPTNGDFVTFLPMYHYFVYYPDCFNGACYVGNPILFRDPLPGHINALGYWVWADKLTNKITELGWHNDITPRYPNGLVWTPVNNQDLGINPPLPPPTTINVDPQPIDWVILFCILTGKCF